MSDEDLLSRPTACRLGESGVLGKAARRRGCEILNVKFTFSNKTSTIVITHNFSGSISHYRLIHQTNGSEQCHADDEL